MTPLLRATLAFCAGLLCGFRVQLDGAPLLLVGAMCLMPLRVRAGHAVVAALIAAGIGTGSLRTTAARNDCRARLEDGAIVRAMITPSALPAEGLSVLAHARVLTAGRAQCTDVSVRVRVRPQLHDTLTSAALQGRAVTVRGRWMAHAPRNGWPRDPAHAGLLLVDSVASTTGGDVSTLSRFRSAQQARLRALLPDRWGLAEAMLLAQTGGLMPETRSRWVAAGLVHVLAISGMHVGLIAAGVMFLGGAAGLPPRRARRIALLITTAYVLFLGAPSAALRALLQAAMLLVSLELQRPAERFTALAAAALAILLLEPLALLNPGFQLSFAGMIGLIAWRAPTASLLPAHWPAFLRDGIASGVAASALTTPIAALHFGTASWIGIPATIVAVPVLSVAIALTVGALAAGVLSDTLARFIAWPADLALRVLDGVAAAAAAVPGGHGHLGTPSVLYLLLGAGAALLVRASLRTHDHPAQHSALQRAVVMRGVLAAGTLSVVFAWAPLLLRAQRGLLEIHVIDVGQGDAIAVRTPRDRWLLVDTGPRSGRFDAGRDRVVPYLLKHGARRLEALVLTHPDADHIGGAEAVLDVFDVGLVVDPGFPAGKDLFIDLLSAARRSDRRWVAAEAGRSFAVDGVEVTLLYPLPSIDGAANANDNSVVFRLSYGRFAALFTGDAPAAVEDAIVERAGGTLPVDVLKVGHHGSRTSTGETLLRAARPDVALISAGRNNRYGHPNPGVLARLEAHGVRVVRTDRSGSFIVRARRDGRTDVMARQTGEVHAAQ